MQRPQIGAVCCCLGIQASWLLSLLWLDQHLARRIHPLAATAPVSMVAVNATQ